MYYRTSLSQQDTQITVTALWCLWKIRCKWLFENKQWSKPEILNLLKMEFSRLLLKLTSHLKNKEQINEFLKKWGSFTPNGANAPAIRRIGKFWIFDIHFPPGSK